MTIVDSLRLHHPDLFLIDGGDWGELGGNFSKSMGLLRGMQALKYDALCMGRREMESTLWDSVSSKVELEKALVANLQPAIAMTSRKLASRPYRVIERNGVKVAVVSVWLENALAANSPLQVLPPEDFLRDQLREIKKADIRLVAIYGNGNNSDTALNALTGKFPEVDAWLLSGGPGRVMNSITGANGALIVGPGDRGRELALLAIEKGKEATQRRVEFKQIVLGKWVSSSPAAKPFLERSIAKNSATTSDISLSPANRFIGNGSCKLCHEQIYDKWRETKHAHALETLVAKQEDKNEKCLACHTTGFGQLTGFGKALDGVELGGVGCEVCHGTGEYHVTTGNRNTVSPQETLCQNCHTTETSPKFVYGEYVKRVH